MQHLLSPWPLTFKVHGVPPLELLQPFLEAPSLTTKHVSWNGVDPAHPEADFRPKTREAVYFWPWDGKALSSLRYPVVRVLFWWLRNVREKGVSILNDCSVVACCNIEHWHIVTPSERARPNHPIVYTAFDSPTYRRKS
jgi:hypothetical protein